MPAPPAPCPCSGVQPQGCAATNTAVGRAAPCILLHPLTALCSFSLAVRYCARYFWDWISANWSQFLGEWLGGEGRNIL